MEKKDDRIDILILIVLFVSALMAVISVTGLFFKGYNGSVFIGSSIMVAGSLICRAMQWASKE